MSASIWLLHQTMGKARRRGLFDHVMKQAAQSITKKTELHKDLWGRRRGPTTKILTILISNTSAVLGYRKFFLQCKKKKKSAGGGGRGGGEADCNF